jgi:anti-anti-sigma factor
VRETVGENHLRGVIVDLGNVTFLSSAGIGALFSLHEFTKERSACLVIARARPAIQRLLNTVKLPDLIPTTKSMDAARSEISQSNSTDSQ